MKMKRLAFAVLMLCALLCASPALAEKNRTTEEINLTFDGVTFTDTVQVEWEERYVVPEGGVKWDGTDEFLFMSDFTNDDLVQCPESDKHADKYVKNQIAFMGVDGKNFYQIEQIAAKYGARIVGYLAPTEDYVIQTVDDKNYDELQEIIKSLKTEEYILPETVVLCYAFPVSMNSIPSDPWGGATWDEQNPDGYNWSVEAIRALSAWDYKDFMDEMNVGIIDSTFFENHPDLRFAVSYDRVDKSDGSEWNVKRQVFRKISNEIQNKTLTQEEKQELLGWLGQFLHGTHVAGTFAAITDNQQGVSGVFPKGNLVGIGVCYQEGDIDVNQGIQNIIDEMIAKYTIMPQEKFRFLVMRHYNVRVINMSMGQDWEPKNIKEIKKLKGNALVSKVQEFTRVFSEEYGFYRFFDRIEGLGYEFVFVQAAGNDTIDSRFAGWPQWVINDYFKNRLITVGSYGKNEEYSEFSNYGPGIDVVAPGESIYSTVVSIPTAFDENESYYYADRMEIDGLIKRWDGTSMAAPHVAGVAAMMMSLNPDMSGAEVKKIISNRGEVIADRDGNKHYKLDASACVQEAFNKAKGTGKLNITVFNKGNGGHLYGYEIEIKPLEICQETETVNIKNIEVYPYVNELKIGKYQITISKNGYRPHTEIITVTRDSEINLNVTLTPTEAPTLTQGTLEGKVVFNSAGVANIEVKVIQKDKLVATLVTNGEGQFRIDLDPGEYLLSVEAQGYVPTSASVTIFIGKKTSVSIALSDSVYAVVKKSFEKGIPTHEITLHNMKTTMSRVEIVVTLSNGYTYIDTANGIYAGTVKTANGAKYQIDDELEQGAQLRVNAWDAQGQVYAGSIVLGIGSWPDKLLPTATTKGGYWDKNGFFH